MKRDICRNYHGGDENSENANGMTNKQKDRLAIMAHLETVEDATCDEVEVALGMKHQTCSARFSEMKKDGEIYPTERRKTRSGCTAQAWSLWRMVRVKEMKV